jgi:uncharacterized delta-60 repeat protein
MSKIKSLLFAIFTALLLAACSQVAEVPQEGLESAATTPGSLDTTFRKSLNGFGNGGGFATNLATLPNNKALVAFSVVDNNNQQFIKVRRYNEDGSQDRTFGGAGNIDANLRDTAGGSRNLTPQALVVTPEGRIFIAATGSDPNFTTEQIIRPIIFGLTPDGVLDSSFDGNGLLFPTTTIADPAKSNVFAKDLAYDPATKKLTLGGTVDPKSGNSFLWTFTVNVNQTTSPKETVVKESGANLGFEKLRRLPNGEMLIAGGITPSSGGSLPRGYLVRQLDNGIIVRKAINVVGFEAFITGLRVDAGKVFLAGSADTTGSLNFKGFVARFDLETLTKDTAFGSGGIRFVSKDVRDIAFSKGSGTAKKIIVVGSDDTDYLAARMSYNGVMDTTFGKNGIALVNFSNFADERTLTVSVDSKNRIWAAGLTESFNDSGFRAGIFRLLP